MTDVFRSEILAVVMQQILDEPVLPTLFMRTVSSVLFLHPSSCTKSLIHILEGDSSRQDIQLA